MESVRTEILKRSGPKRVKWEIIFTGTLQVSFIMKLLEDLRTKRGPSFCISADEEFIYTFTSLQLRQPKTEYLKKSFSCSGAKLWNSLPAAHRNSEKL